MTDAIVRLFLLLAIFASVFLVVQITASSAVFGRQRSKAVNERLRMIEAGSERGSIIAELRKNAPTAIYDDATFFERILIRMQRMLLMARIRTDPVKLLIMLAGGFGLVFVILLVASLVAGFSFDFGLLQLLLALSAALALGIPYLLISRRAQKRRKRMQEQFPIALDIFVRALRSGHPIASALDLLTSEMEDPIGSEFGLVVDEISYGAELTDALQAMAERWDMDDIRMFVVSLSIQNETGGNLAEILQNLGEVIRARASMYLKVRALSSEGRMSGWMLTALPVITFLSMFLVNPSFYLDAASDPIFIYGFPALIILYFIGVLMIRRLVNLEV